MEFSGTITGNASVKTVKGDREVVTFSVALNERFKPKGAAETKERTIFINVAWWRSTVIAGILRKGAVVTVTGWLYPDAYINQDGKAVGRINCNASDIKLIRSGKAAETAKPAPQPADLTEPVDNLPF